MAAISLSCGDCPPGKAVRDGAFATGNLCQVVLTTNEDIDEDAENSEASQSGINKTEEK